MAAPIFQSMPKIRLMPAPMPATLPMLKQTQAKNVTKPTKVAAALP